MRLLAALLLVSCGSADAGFGQPGDAGRDAPAAFGSAQSGSGGATTGGQPSAGGRVINIWACEEIDCLPKCTDDPDCPADAICVNSMQNDPAGGFVKVCRPVCSSKNDCIERGGGCVGFRGADCLGGNICPPEARYACALRQVCVLSSNCTAE